ncbi:hypothetical protein GGR57DRAFT_475989 [Xylariaceae sp. FL1272]|nr:hypothetical protein GGR57DRAFT_475989 [Xylariaceae sp. FL1272]
MSESEPVSYSLIEWFFKQRPGLQEKVDAIAREIAGPNTVIEPVEDQGSLSRTFILADNSNNNSKTVLSFRLIGGKIDDNVAKLASHVHEGLVPKTEYHDVVGEGDDALYIYKMECLPGTPWSEIFPRVVDRTPVEQKKCEVLETFFQEVEAAIPVWFGEDWPKVLAHGDLSPSNLLVDEATSSISGIIDWSLASIRPFGTDLKTLLVAQIQREDDDKITLHEDSDNLREMFWEEFWKRTEVEEEKRGEVRRLAELAGKMNFITGMVFLRDFGKLNQTLHQYNDGLINAYFGDGKN